MNTSSPCGYGKPDRKQREARYVVIEVMRYQRLMSTGQIERALSAEWGVAKRTIRSYMQRVKERMALQAEHDPDRLSRHALTEAMLTQYQATVQLAELAESKAKTDPAVLGAALRGRRDAVKALSILGEFHGLRVQRHEISGPGGAPLTMTPEQAADEMRKIVEDIAGRRRAETPPPAPTPAAEGDGSEEDEP